MSSDYDKIEVTDAAGGAEFPVKVVPNSSRTRVAGMLGGTLKLAVAAPPEGGKANSQVIELLAKLLERRRADVEIRAGTSRPAKRVFVAGLSAEDVRQRLVEAIRRARGTD